MAANLPKIIAICLSGGYILFVIWSLYTAYKLFSRNKNQK